MATAIQNKTGKFEKIALPGVCKIFPNVVSHSMLLAVAWVTIALPIPKNKPAIGNIAIGSIRPRDNLATNSRSGLSPDFSPEHLAGSFFAILDHLHLIIEVSLWIGESSNWRCMFSTEWKLFCEIFIRGIFLSLKSFIMKIYYTKISWMFLYALMI